MFKAKNKYKEISEHDKQWLIDQVEFIPDEAFTLRQQDIIYSKKHDKYFNIHHMPRCLKFIHLNYVRFSPLQCHIILIDYIKDHKLYDINSRLINNYFCFHCSTKEHNRDINEKGNIPISIFDIGRNYILVKPSKLLNYF